MLDLSRLSILITIKWLALTLIWRGKFAKSLGKDLKVEDMSFDGLLPALDSGQIDMVAAGMTVTPEREKNALFSDPYYSASQRIIC